MAKAAKKRKSKHVSMMDVLQNYDFHTPQELKPTTPDVQPSLTAQFDEAMESITDDRGSVYGHPADDFGRVADMSYVLDDCADPVFKHILYMILVKVSRLIQSPEHLDSWTDIAGYSKCAVMVLDRRKQKPDSGDFGPA